MPRPSDTPMTDTLEPLVERLEAQLPATRRAMDYEKNLNKEAK